VYAKNGQAVMFVAGERWSDGMPGVCDAGSYEITYAREFRYDSGRARYLNRELLPVHTPNSPPGTPEWTFTIQSETWTDYEGDEPYGDYAVDTQGGGPPSVTNLRSFELGMGTVNPWTSGGSENTSHYHGDLIGTTRSISDAAGMMGTGEVYTAFGERVSTTAVDEGNRYGYAGAWGYQAHGEFPFLHVGARYYDPGIGRFLQRDPIGIWGGLNVYMYVGSGPAFRADPSGLVSSLQRPEGIIAVLEAEIASCGHAYITINGRTYLVKSIISHTTAGGATTSTLVTSGGGHIATWTWRAGQTVLKEGVVRTSGGVAIESAGGAGACGATGAEAIPFLWILTAVRGKRRALAVGRIH
jgi:RHS repeat-associated protein